MKREILFRGKRVDNGDFVYGDLIHTPENKTRIIWFEPMYSDDIHFYKDHNYEVIPETVGQFIGLTDKNGVKIFEGDKINYDDVIGVVLYNNDTCMFLVKFDYTRSTHDFDFLEREIEVIGNIHENKIL